MTFAKAHLLAGLCVVSAAFVAAPAHANSAAMDYFTNRQDRSAVPKLLSQDERTYYKTLFAAVDHEDWVQVQTLLAQQPDGPLHLVARAEYYLDANSPKIESAEIEKWLSEGASLPQAEQMAALAAKRGLELPVLLPSPQALITQPSAPKRLRPRDTNDGTMPFSTATGIMAKIKADDPISARILLDGIDPALSPAARAEWRSRVAWAFYINNDDTSALALGQSASEGAGPWVAEGWWTAGLAAWRMANFQAAADAFGKAANLTANAELKSAAWYWQSRSYVRSRQPELASAPLRLAAARDETLYGMMAAEQLGLKIPETHGGADFTLSDWQLLRDQPNVRTAVALAEIGEDGLADEVLRHQARIGSPALYKPLSRLARDLGLPSTQLWMAYNAPTGGRPEAAIRYPTPKWTPATGWKVDPALIYAHTLQESIFRTKVVSPAGARGLMQIMPSAARDRSIQLGLPGSATDLTRPEVNLAFGQAHLQMLKDQAGTQGLLPKVMAAYNAGILPITKWNAQIHDQGDPLLWIESIPYWETRGYVNVVMRNYWMYERQAGGPSETRMALVQGMWPTFPGLNGSQGLRMAANGAIIRGR
ncbi:MAG: hypothetical protein RLZZ136_1008 [Pseudomonadota bacterium]